MKIDREKFTEKVMQAELLKKQAETATSQLENVIKSLSEMSVTKDALGEISGLPVGTETLVPLGSGIYLKGTISDKKSVFIGLGAETIVEKDISEAVAILDEQMKKLEDAREHLNSTSEQINETLKILVPELEEMARQAQIGGAGDSEGEDGFVRVS